jgi:hypothetical protein
MIYNCNSLSEHTADRNSTKQTWRWGFLWWPLKQPCRQRQLHSNGNSGWVLSLLNYSTLHIFCKVLTFFSVPEILTRKWSSMSLLGGGWVHRWSSPWPGTLVSTCPYQSEPVCWIVRCLLRWHRYVYCHRIMNGDIQFSVKQVHLPAWTFLRCVGYDCSILTFSLLFPLCIF